VIGLDDLWLLVNDTSKSMMYTVSCIVDLDSLPGLTSLCNKRNAVSLDFDACTRRGMNVMIYAFWDRLSDIYKYGDV